jgi:hypothetical protein
MIDAGDKALKNRLDRAVSRLMAVHVDSDTARVSVPVLYPSGSGCSVEIIVNDGRCFVSDLALGHLEAEMQGADEFYGHSAKRAADHFGVGYDGLSVFAQWASLDKIETAVAAVANASVQAATSAILRAAEETYKHKNIEVFELVREIFGPQLVAKSMDIGGRDASWEAHNVVTFPDRQRAIFEFVSESQNSIANKFMMFSDLSKADSPGLSLNSVVKSLARIGKKGAMLAEVSNVIELSANVDEFKRYARVA